MQLTTLHILKLDWSIEEQENVSHVTRILLYEWSDEEQNDVPHMTRDLEQFDIN